MIDPAFINGDGFVTVEPHAQDFPGEGNGFLQTGLAFALGEYTADFEAMISRCRHSSACPYIYRSPYKRNMDDQQACDDYWGVLPLSQPWALEVLEYAEKNGWAFNIQDQLDRDIRWRFDRYPSFVPFLRLCAGKKITLIEDITLALSIMCCSISKADENMKSFCMIHAVENKTGLCKFAASVWRNRIIKKYGRVSASWSAYFGADHPLSKVL